MKPSNTIVVSPKYIEEKERQIAELSKTIERLQEQLNEANEVIIYAYNLADAYDEIEKYFEKWGVK